MPNPTTSPSLEEKITKEPAPQISEINSKLESLSIPPSSSSPSITRSPSRTSSIHTNTDSNAAKPISTPQTPTSDSTPEDVEYDLICVGFGPASLSIGIALHDKYNSSCQSQSQAQSHPKVLYLSNQASFRWHSGMQLPSTKMQISFLKDLATPRLPTSRFTFLNYLHAQGRLDHFINLGTFLPARREYEDYLRWCAQWFVRKGEVEFGVQVESLVGVGGEDGGGKGKVGSWDVVGRRDGADGEGEILTWRAKHVVIAVGGKPVIPPVLREVENVYHSSEYAYRILRIQESELEKKRKKKGNKLKFAVVGGGQSAVEIFNDLWERFGEDVEVKLIVKGSSLRPSDDSPFVNEIFNASNVSTIYSLPATQRVLAISSDKSTNYGVVRLELLERLYEKMYEQRFDNPDEKQWRCQILPNRIVNSIIPAKSGSGMLLNLGDTFGNEKEGEVVEVDYVFAGTGYVRNAHEQMLEGTKELLPIPSEVDGAGMFKVGRDYRVSFDKEKVDCERAGVWLQGCNEATHGLSDTLLSILAIRGGEIVDSIFGKEMSKGKEQ